MIIKRYELLGKAVGLEIYESCFDNMSIYCRETGQRETGGILVGYYSVNHQDAIVTMVSSPPRDSIGTRSTFYRGIEGLNEWLNTVWIERGWYYLGEWHFHPDAGTEPSRRDHRQMKEIACSQSYKCPEPILIILGGMPPHLNNSVYLYSDSSQPNKFSKVT